METDKEKMDTCDSIVIKVTVVDLGYELNNCIGINDNLVRQYYIKVTDRELSILKQSVYNVYDDESGTYLYILLKKLSKLKPHTDFRVEPPYQRSYVIVVHNSGG